MKLVLVHGRRQQDQDPDFMRQTWINAINDGLDGEGFPEQAEVVLPFYGNLLTDLMLGGVSGGGVVARGSDNEPDEFEASLLLELAAILGVTDQETRALLQDQSVDRGMSNRAWVIAAARAMTNKAPWMTDAFISRFVRDVHAYLKLVHIRSAVNDLVASCLNERCVIVSHSLGSVVAYWVLREHEEVEVPLFVTLGSPLGIKTIRANLPPPLIKPKSIQHWLNASDSRDPVAMHPRLERSLLPWAIENISDIRHEDGKDPHDVYGYLADPVIATRIRDALLREH